MRKVSLLLLLPQATTLDSPCLNGGSVRNRPVFPQTAILQICPNYRQNVCCDDLVLVKIKDTLDTLQTSCVGCIKNVQAFLCHALCQPQIHDMTPVIVVNPVFCAAGQLACQDQTFCRSQGKLSTLLSDLAQRAATVDVGNDFSVMPLSAECEKRVDTTDQTSHAITAPNSSNKLWILILVGICAGMFLSRKPNKHSPRVVVWEHVEPEESSRLLISFVFHRQQHAFRKKQAYLMTLTY